MIVTGISQLTLLATSILTILMFAAFITHIRAKHSIIQMMPSFTLMCSSIVIALNTLTII